MPDEDRIQRLVDFVAWVGKHIEGDEKGEAQPFLDRLFIAFGHGGAKSAGAVFEKRIKRFDKHKGYADCVWDGVALIEMKKRGADLSRHVQQLTDYWIHLAPGRPAYSILCNFDEFWIFDFNKDMLAPVEKIGIGELAERYGALAFLFPTGEEPVFGDDHEAVTREAADYLAAAFNSIIDRGVQRERAQRFTLQMLVCLFAEDIGLLERYFVTRLLEECDTPERAFDRLDGLFRAMNDEEGVRGGRYKGVRYFNGGLFAESGAIELTAEEVGLLLDAAHKDWSRVRPEIFGTIFEHSMDGEERHAFGAHFTSQLDILKIVKPTIVDPWEALIERTAKGPKPVQRLNELHMRLQNYRVLDPACGSGNFLYLAYRELKRVEAKLIDAIQGASKDKTKMFGRVTTRQFFGMDINPFAVELAKVTLMLARKLAVDELHIDEDALPLDNLDANFTAGDALITEVSEGAYELAPWPEADVIIGNPPFLDARKTTVLHGELYTDALEGHYVGVPGRADYCVYWIRRGHDHLPVCSAEDPVAGRAGLVGTQNIRNNYSREGGLDHVVGSGAIVEAVQNQPWSGEANVHVSIANWVKTGEGEVDEQALLIPEAKKLWHKVEAKRGGKKKRGKKGQRADKTYELAYRETRYISSSLSDATDVTSAIDLATNQTPKRCFEGVQPGHTGFRLRSDDVDRLIRNSPESRAVLVPYLNGTALLTDKWRSRPESIIDFGEMNALEAGQFERALELVRERVFPKWEQNAREERERTGRDTGEHQRRLETWWLFKRARRDMVRELNALSRFIACSRVTKRPIFGFVSREWRPDSSLTVFSLEDDYSFGVISSSIHACWFHERCSNLKSDPRYTPETVWNTFPWPQGPTREQVLAVAEAGREVRRVRDQHLGKGGLRALYRTLELPGKNPLRDAHSALDAAVMDAYGFDAKQDLLAQILALNLEVAAKEAKGEAVQGPGVPGCIEDADEAGLITDDCIRAQ